MKTTPKLQDMGRGGTAYNCPRAAGKPGGTVDHVQLGGRIPEPDFPAKKLDIGREAIEKNVVFQPWHMVFASGPPRDRLVNDTATLPRSLHS
jgi:hypothetical protein